MSAHRFYGRKDSFIRAALATGKYRVDACGVVYNLDVRGTGAEAELKVRLDASGYPVVHLFDGMRRQPVLLHRVVAMVFLGPPPTGRPQVNHKNRDKLDASAGNLEWCSPSENMRHEVAAGAYRREPPRLSGDDHPRRKLNSDAVRNIHHRLAQSQSHETIAKGLGVSQSTVSRIASGRIWRDVYAEFHGAPANTGANPRRETASG